MNTAYVLLAALVASSVLTLLWRRVAMRYSILDIPNERSSHQYPVPRGAGVAIVISFLAFVAVMYINAHFSMRIAAAIFAGSFIAVLGFLDDLTSLPVRRRLVIQVVIATCATGFLAGELTFLDVAAYRPVYLACLGLLAVGIVWQLNLFNFMDGIDGLAGAQAVFVGMSGAVLCGWLDERALGLLWAGLACSSLGFLIWNWSPAKVFMGDVGSGFLGFVIAVVALVSASGSDLSLWTFGILMGAFIVDTSVTALRRLLNGEVLYVAHRSHAYQRCARRFGSHGKVALAFLAINVLWLFPLAVLSVVYGSAAWLVTIVALLPLAVVAVCVGGGKAEGFSTTQPRV